MPLKDLLQTALWFLAFMGNRIEWRGQRMRLRRDGTLVKPHSISSVLESDRPPVLYRQSPTLSAPVAACHHRSKAQSFALELLCRIRCSSKARTRSTFRKLRIARSKSFPATQSTLHCSSAGASCRNQTQNWRIHASRLSSPKRSQPPAMMLKSAFIEDGGEIVAIFPFQRKAGGHGVPVGGIVSDYHGLICRRRLLV